MHTDTVAESASVSKIGEELSPTHVVEQHVEAGVVMCPPPPAQRNTRQNSATPRQDPTGWNKTRN